jgi:exodeoxyribonuclease VII large subunit
MAIKPIKVSQLNGYIKRVLQTDPLLGNVSVIGEVSNLKYHGSGHVYFTLKDETSKLNCFLPSERRRELRYELSDGAEIVAAGYVYLHERGGTYSLNIRDIAVEGVGNLTAAFDRLKDKLAKEGIFDERHKKPIPVFPRKIAVITSETGAAVQDIIKTIRSRSNVTDVLVYPCLVQGPGAAAEIAEAIRSVNRLFPETDVIIAGRGGGSMEELWAFNEEIVARSIFASRIPIISAVGHETDFTIADFAADKRAATPTAAAQLASPDVAALKEVLASGKADLLYTMQRTVRYMELRVTANRAQTLAISLSRRLSLYGRNAEALQRELTDSLKERLTEWSVGTELLKAGLDALNPKNVMARGYAAILDGQGKLTGSADRFDAGSELTAVMRDGELECAVVARHSANRLEERGKERG